MAILAGGPSLTAKQVNACHGRVRVIAVNTSYKLAPWADLLYACDEKWWGWHDGAPGFAGIKVGLKWNAVAERWETTWENANWPGIHAVAGSGNDGIDLRPGYIRTGGNSGYQAINLAVQLGVRRIVLLGFDCKMGAKKEKHWHPDHPDGSGADNYQTWIANYAALAPQLEKLGVEVINANPESGIEAFPKMTLEAAWKRWKIAA